MVPIFKFPHLQWLVLEFRYQDYRMPDTPKETIAILSKAFDSVQHLVYVNNDLKHIISATDLWPNFCAISRPHCYLHRDDETAKTLDALWRQRAAMPHPLDKMYTLLCSSDLPVESWLEAYDEDLVYGILSRQFNTHKLQLSGSCQIWVSAIGISGIQQRPLNHVQESRRLVDAAKT